MEEKKQAGEIVFLDGPKSRWQEFKFAWHAFMQLIRGFRHLHFVGPCVTVFGSARFKEGHLYYGMAREMGQAISKLGFTVLTGGGPGIMEAANRGAREAGGKSVGCNIVLPSEQHPNSYLDKWVNIDVFFVRKALLRKYSYAFVVMPGGFGTLDEFFEAVTLIQTHKSENFPVVIMGTDYYSDLIQHLEKMKAAGTIDPADTSIVLFTDCVKEAITHIQKHTANGFGLKPYSKRKPAWWLGERS